MAAARKQHASTGQRHPAHKPSADARPDHDTAKDSPAKPGSRENPVAVKSRPGAVYVAVDMLSWRPHPLPRGTEVSDILPKPVIEQGLEDGRLSREAPEA